MTPLMSLLLPVVLSAVAVFVLSSVIHMAMPWHKNDYVKVPDEDGLMAAMRPFGLAVGDYMMPRPNSGADFKSPEFMAKVNKGPVAIMTIRPGTWNMGQTMGTWFVFTLLVSIVAACMTGAVMAPGVDHRRILHFVGAITFLCYAMGGVPQSIWYGRKWSTTFKHALDALIYGAATGAIFMMMWPQG